MTRYINVFHKDFDILLLKAKKVLKPTHLLYNFIPTVSWDHQQRQTFSQKDVILLLN